MTTRETIRLFIWSGLVWRLVTLSYWTMFFVRVVVDVQLDPLQLVLLGTTKELTILAAEIPTGVVADLVSRRRSVIIAYFVCGAAIVGAGVAPTFVTLAATQALWAFGSTFRSGAETAWVTDEVGSIEAVDAALVRRGRYESAGAIVGVLIASVGAALFGLTAVLVAIGIVLIGWGAWLTVVMEETGFVPPTDPIRTNLAQQLRRGATASRQPGLRVLLIVTVLTGFASEAVDRLDVARLEQIGFPDSIDVPVLIGSIVVAQMVAAIVLLFAFRRRLTGRSLVVAFALLNAVTALGVGALAVGRAVEIAIAGLVVAGTVRDISRTVSTAWANHFTSASDRATVHSFVGQSMSLGEISGGVVLGFIAQQTGIASALTVAALVYLIGSATSMMGRRRWTTA